MYFIFTDRSHVHMETRLVLVFDSIIYAGQASLNLSLDTRSRARDGRVTSPLVVQRRQWSHSRLTSKHWQSWHLSPMAMIGQSTREALLDLTSRLIRNFSCRLYEYLQQYEQFPMANLPWHIYKSQEQCSVWSCRSNNSQSKGRFQLSNSIRNSI